VTKLERVHNESNPLLQEITNPKGLCTFSRTADEKRPRHYLIPLTGNNEGPVFEEFRKRGASRFCNRCYGYDFAKYCRARVWHGVWDSVCGLPATVELSGWDIYGHQVGDGLHGHADKEQRYWCGKHDWEKKASRQAEQDAVMRAKWAAHDAERLATRKRQEAAAALVESATAWRKLHFTETPCDGCEHLDCALARSVDAL